MLALLLCARGRKGRANPRPFALSPPTPPFSPSGDAGPLFSLFFFMLSFPGHLSPFLPPCFPVLIPQQIPSLRIADSHPLSPPVLGRLNLPALFPRALIAGRAPATPVSVIPERLVAPVALLFPAPQDRRHQHQQQQAAAAPARCQTVIRSPAGEPRCTHAARAGQPGRRRLASPFRPPDPHVVMVMDLDESALESLLMPNPAADVFLPAAPHVRPPAYQPPNYLSIQSPRHYPDVRLPACRC